VIFSEDDLRELFSQHGDVSQVHIVVDRESKRSKGIGYVLFASPESAVRCVYLLSK
jgi:multiple RNA-binding domain-containing protein 1